jgi:hypothetical protein
VDWSAIATRRAYLSLALAVIGAIVLLAGICTTLIGEAHRVQAIPGWRTLVSVGIMLAIIGFLTGVAFAVVAMASLRDRSRADRWDEDAVARDPRDAVAAAWLSPLRGGGMGPANRTPQAAAAGPAPAVAVHEPEPARGDPASGDPGPPLEPGPARYDSDPVVFGNGPVAYEPQAAAYQAEPAAYQAGPAAYQAGPAARAAESAGYESGPVGYESEGPAYSPEPTAYQAETAGYESEAAPYQPETGGYEPEPVAYDAEPARYETGPGEDESGPAPSARAPFAEHAPEAATAFPAEPRTGFDPGLAAAFASGPEAAFTDPEYQSEPTPFADVYQSDSYQPDGHRPDPAFTEEPPGPEIWPGEPAEEAPAQASHWPEPAYSDEGWSLDGEDPWARDPADAPPLPGLPSPEIHHPVRPLTSSHVAGRHSTSDTGQFPAIRDTGPFPAVANGQEHDAGAQRPPFDAGEFPAFLPSPVAPDDELALQSGEWQPARRDEV